MNNKTKTTAASLEELSDNDLDMAVGGSKFEEVKVAFTNTEERRQIQQPAKDDPGIVASAGTGSI